MDLDIYFDMPSSISIKHFYPLNDVCIEFDILPQHDSIMKEHFCSLGIERVGFSRFQMKPLPMKFMGSKHIPTFSLSTSTCHP